MDLVMLPTDSGTSIASAVGYNAILAGGRAPATAVMDVADPTRGGALDVRVVVDRSGAPSVQCAVPVTGSRQLTGAGVDDGLERRNGQADLPAAPDVPVSRVARTAGSFVWDGRRQEDFFHHCPPARSAAQPRVAARSTRVVWRCGRSPLREPEGPGGAHVLLLDPDVDGVREGWQ